MIKIWKNCWEWKEECHHSLATSHSRRRCKWLSWGDLPQTNIYQKKVIHDKQKPDHTPTWLCQKIRHYHETQNESIINLDTNVMDNAFESIYFDIKYSAYTSLKNITHSECHWNTFEKVHATSVHGSKHLVFCTLTTGSNSFVGKSLFIKKPKHVGN